MNNIESWIPSMHNQLAYDFPLDMNSVVMVAGGYHGWYVQRLAEKYNPTICVFEPVSAFYKILVNKFKDNKKILLYNFGLFSSTTISDIHLSDDRSSIYKLNQTNSVEKSEQIILYDIDEVIKIIPFSVFRLFMINIEGSEYELLSRMLECNLIKRFENILVQFHKGIVKNDIEKRATIQKQLLDFNYTQTFNCDFVFENWRKNA